MTSNMTQQARVSHRDPDLSLDKNIHELVCVIGVLLSKGGAILGILLELRLPFGDIYIF
eukprot:COSAG01_NODE_5068_length_4513_cov_5.091980_1_plen_59_part_00